MKKRLTTIMMCLAFAALATAQTPTTPDPVDVTIDSASILYWVGTGENYAILAINWAEPDTALAWGFRWDGTATVRTMIDSIEANDPRIWFDAPTYMNDIYYVMDNGDTIHLSPWDEGFNMWTGNLNGFSNNAGLVATLSNGDFVKYGENKCGTGYDFQYGYFMEYAFTTPIVPVPVPTTTTPDTNTTPVDATIAESDILYWVGTGNNNVILAVNWADTALAWGYRFNGDKTVSDMMDDIAAADPRFSYTLGEYGLEDILFAVAPGDTLRKQAYSWWESKNNGVMDMGMGQTLANGDFEKWAEPAAGVVVDSTYYDGWGWSYTYVYPMTIHPVSVPAEDTTHQEPEHGPFCGAVGTEGCDAIAANSDSFVAWATGCTVERGPQNISVEGSPLVTYGSDSMAIGTVSFTDNLAVVSLGDGGSATLTFANPIKNGEGADFAVFENSFDDSFLELAFVEVSSNGTDFVRFPATSLTQTETQIGPNGHVDPTFINNLAGKYRKGWGTPFDLDDLAGNPNIDLNNITHVRIVDVVGSIDPEYGTYDAFGNIVNDPFPTNSYSGGFDLAGIGVIHQSTSGIDDVEAMSLAVNPNPAHDFVRVKAGNGLSEVRIFDMTGRMVKSVVTDGDATIDIRDLNEGVYIVKVGTMARKLVVK